jgi:hypothetical protein
MSLRTVILSLTPRNADVAGLGPHFEHRGINISFQKFSREEYSECSDLWRYRSRELFRVMRRFGLVSGRDWEMLVEKKKG